MLQAVDTRHCVRLCGSLRAGLLLCTLIEISAGPLAPMHCCLCAHFDVHACSIRWCHVLDSYYCAVHARALHVYMTRALAIAALHLRVHSSSPSCLVEEGIHYQISREFFGHVLTTGSTASNSCRAMMTLLICVCVMCDHPHVDDDDDDDRLRIGLLLEEAAWTRAPSVPR